jgi:hypothetical protein
VEDFLPPTVEEIGWRRTVGGRWCGRRCLDCWWSASNERVKVTELSRPEKGRSTWSEEESEVDADARWGSRPSVRSCDSPTT